MVTWDLECDLHRCTILHQILVFEDLGGFLDRVPRKAQWIGYSLSIHSHTYVLDSFPKDAGVSPRLGYAVLKYWSEWLLWYQLYIGSPAHTARDSVFGNYIYMDRQEILDGKRWGS